MFKLILIVRLFSKSGSLIKNVCLFCDELKPIKSSEPGERLFVKKNNNAYINIQHTFSQRQKVYPLQEGTGRQQAIPMKVDGLLSQSGGFFGWKQTILRKQTILLFTNRRRSLSKRTIFLIDFMNDLKSISTILEIVCFSLDRRFWVKAFGP